MRRAEAEAGRTQPVPLLIVLGVVLAAVLLPALWRAEPAPPAASAPQPAPAPPLEDAATSADRFTAAAAGAEQPIARAVRWLEAQQRPDGSFPSASYERPGTTALCYWVIRHAVPSRERRRPSTTRALAWLRHHADPARYAAGDRARGNYDAALTLVALWHHYRRLGRNLSSAEMRRSVTAEDAALIGRLARYVYGCASTADWRYAADRPAGTVRPAPRPAEASPVPPGRLAMAEPEARHHRRYWRGDNSNAGYGWMGLRAAALLGVRVMDDAFVRAEFERMLASRCTTGVRRPVRLVRHHHRVVRGFTGVWSHSPLEHEVWIGGWSYAHGRQVPAMTASTIASLLYCWQEADERGLLSEADRRRALAAVLGALGSLRAAADPAVFCEH